jgi:hypothetical protein
MGLLPGWLRASCRDAKGRTGQASQATQKAKGHERKILAETAELAGWRSPQSGNATQGPKSDEHFQACQATNKSQITLTDQVGQDLAGWATPRLEDGESAGMRHSRGVADTLSAQVGQDLAGWTTPAARDEKGIDQNLHDGAVNNSLPNQVAVLGPTSSSSPAGTERRGVLNPAFPLWLMGFPATWQHSCPGWKRWDTMQRLLAESSEKSGDTE